jgi:hypothetical protein
MNNKIKSFAFILALSIISIGSAATAKAAVCPTCGPTVSGCTCGTNEKTSPIASSASNRYCCPNNETFYGSAASCTSACSATTPVTTTPTSSASGSLVNIENPIGTDDFTELVTNLLGWLLGIAGALALLMFVWGGILYVTSAGDEQKAAKGKRIVTWTILGLIVILMSYSIIALIEDIFVNE